MMKSITETLRQAYMANGGTEEGFNARKDRLMSEYRQQAAIKAAIDEANRPPDMNQLLREMVDRKLDGRRMRGTLDVRTLDNKKEARNG